MNRIPRQFYAIKGHMLVDNPPLRRGDELLICKNLSGYLAYNATTNCSYYIQAGIIRDDTMFETQEVVK